MKNAIPSKKQRTHLLSYSYVYALNLPYFYYHKNHKKLH